VKETTYSAQKVKASAPPQKVKQIYETTRRQNLDERNLNTLCDNTTSRFLTDTFDSVCVCVCVCVTELCASRLMGRATLTHWSL